MGEGAFRGVLFKVLRLTEQTDESDKGQTNVFRAILRSKSGDRIKVMSVTPFAGWRPGTQLFVRISARNSDEPDADLDESAGVKPKPKPEPADVVVDDDDVDVGVDDDE